ncbi:MAG: hypothetical protein JO332_09715 [Planctomycetaceae bacterium]|nr:hypothetical protein [Planctomycetaceae bacterium]
MMPTILLVLLAVQDNEYVQKLDKVKYNLATKSCREAEKKIGTDDAGAIERLSRLLDDPELSKKECLLFIQQTDQYDPPVAFLPYQSRARARLSLAARTASAPDRKALLEQAVADLEESIRRNVKSSVALRDAAREELAQLAPAPPDAAPALRARHAQLLAERRYRSARTLLDRDGAALPAQERADLASQADQRCRAFLTEELRRFRGRLQAVASVADLRAMTQDEFDLCFELPAPAEIAIVHPSVEWAREATEVFRDVRAGRKPGSALLGPADGASRLEENGEYPWLKLCGALAFRELREDVERRLTECADAPKSRREPLAAEIQARLEVWKGFADRLAPAVRRHAGWIDEDARILRELADRQPREAPGLGADDLRRCFERFPLEPELAAYESKLRAVESGGAWTKESRQALYTLLVAARATRLLLEGQTEEEAGRGVRQDLENLKRVGGAVDPDRFGPRLRRIYDSLR